MTRRAGRVAALAIAAVAAGHAASAAVIEEIVASVNGKIITRSELLEREREVVSQLSSRYVGDELDREVERMHATLLTDMIRELILLQRAEILGLELDKVYQQALSQLKEQQGIKTNEDLEQVLKQEGITKEELRETLLRFNVPDIMVNLEVREKIAVTEEEVTGYFEKNKESFRVGESFTIKEIVLLREGRTPEELEALGRAVMDEVKAGAPFNELVVKHSQAPSRFRDGLIGPLGPGELAPEIESRARELEPGGVGAPIPSRAGLHILQLESHVLPKEPTLEDSRTKVTSHLKQEKFAEALQRYFKMLMETSRIKVNPNYQSYDRRT